MKHKVIRHEFVDLIPDFIDEGILYISTTCATATHRCGCGCGEIVVTPIRPSWWTLVWDGKTVTMNPSIGNWSLSCRSHYWIKENKIVWARKWDDLEIKGYDIKDKITRTWCYGRLKRWICRT